MYKRQQLSMPQKYGMYDSALNSVGFVECNTSYSIVAVSYTHLDVYKRQGLDSLLSTVQMPQGVPVATVAIGKSGARNAAILACQMIGLNDKSLQDKIVEFKKEQAQKVLEQSIVE